MKYYYGIGGEYLHDAGFTLLDENGNIHFAAMGERYTGKKHDWWLPRNIREQYATLHKNTEIIQSDDWIWRTKFRTEFEKEADHQQKEYCGQTDELWDQHPYYRALHHNVRTPTHHVAHAAAAFATRPKSFAKEDCVVVVIDGVGEMRSAIICDSNLNVVHEMTFPRSIGYLYGWMTERIGMVSNEDEYVTMGLSCYGEPTQWQKMYEMFQCVPEWTMKEQDGFDKIVWREKYVAKRMFLDKMCDQAMLAKNHEDAAASLQKMTEQVILDFMKIARKYGSKLCYSGGVAQNIMANVLVSDLFDDMWVDVNPGDGGGSLGAAAYFYMQDTGADRINWEHPFLGHCIEGDLDPEKVVDYLTKNRVCGIANGPAEFSYRAYGNRSLIADVRYDVKDTVNEIKQRQKYRPFAPAILEEYVDEYFEGKYNKWMQYTAKAKHDYSSVTHVDGTGRVQVVPKDSQTVFRKILECYHDRTGVPMLLNTSLNIRGKPMVNDEHHAKEFEDKYGVKVFTS